MSWRECVCGCHEDMDRLRRVLARKEAELEQVRLAMDLACAIVPPAPTLRLAMAYAVVDEVRPLPPLELAGSSDSGKQEAPRLLA